MSTGLKITLIIVSVLTLITLAIFGYFMSAKFTAERFEQAILAQDEGMQNTWGMVEQSLKMKGFTVKNYGETFMKTVELQAKRYENDKNAMMKWVQESSNQLSPATHEKFMDAIEKAYTKKERRQLEKISVAQEYRTYLSATFKGSFIAKGVFNYPSDKAKTIMDRVITTKATKKTWDTGVEEDVTDPFGAK